MKGSVVQTLILSDWNRHRWFIALSITGGVLALALVHLGGEIPTILGSTWFFVSLIVLGSMLPMSNVINERKKQTLPFLMSLPISVIQYTAAKILSTVGMFLMPWSALVIAATSLIAVRRDIPNGLIPLIIVAATFTFLGFCVIAGAALISESEGWTVAATVVSNSLYGFVWYLLIRSAAIRADLKSPVVVWSNPILTILAAEIAAIVVILALTFYVQTRKRDFV
jgi:ABC-2 type transport system permease protein